jgi:hypothetical protein
MPARPGAGREERRRPGEGPSGAISSSTGGWSSQASRSQSVPRRRWDAPRRQFRQIGGGLRVSVRSRSRRSRCRRRRRSRSPPTATGRGGGGRFPARVARAARHGHARRGARRRDAASTGSGWDALPSITHVAFQPGGAPARCRSGRTRSADRRPRSGRARRAECSASRPRAVSGRPAAVRATRGGAAGCQVSSTAPGRLFPPGVAGATRHGHADRQVSANSAGSVSAARASSRRGASGRASSSAVTSARSAARAASPGRQS